MAKVLLSVFVDYESLGKTINILTGEGVTGFYCIEYWGLSPQNWSGFVIKEEPEMAIGAIKDNTEGAIQVNAVVNDDRAEQITQALTERLSDRRHTIIKLPVDAIRLVTP